MKTILLLAVPVACLLAQTTVTTPLGALEGTDSSGLRIFRGVPFAQPPIGPLRFAPPAAPAKWTGTRDAKAFGPRCMQQPLFGDMNFRSPSMSEDCLYLNIWAPPKSAGKRLPVMVYFFGGGFQAGDSSEPRYDGEIMARKGIVAVTVNYRLGVFGFLAHAALTADSPNHASGNYGLLDQSAALHWVKDNIAAFGGDPKRVTIAGESAGSTSVSAQMASPLSRDLIAGAIGESGSAVSTQSQTPRATVEAQGAKFAALLNINSAADLRKATAQQIFEAAAKPGAPRFNVCVDGYFFPEPPAAIYAAGKQAHVPLLAGWNSEESNARGVLGREAPTLDNFRKAVERLYGEHAAAILKHYAPVSDAEVAQAATDLAGDRFIAFSTWKWIDVAANTGGKSVYRYYFERPRPKMTAAFAGATANLAGGVTRNANTPQAPLPKGAVHSAEIEYALGNLEGNKVYDWEPEDFQVSRLMQEYFANFIKKGDPNSPNTPKWPAIRKGKEVPVMHINVNSQSELERNRGRYETLDKIVK